MERSEELFDRAKKVLPGGVNSPVRAYRAVGMTPRFISKADGAYIWDADGNRYIDYVCSWGPMILGHNHPIIREAVQEAIMDGLSFGAPTQREVEIAEHDPDGAPYRDGPHGELRYRGGHVRTASGKRRYRTGENHQI